MNILKLLIILTLVSCGTDDSSSSGVPVKKDEPKQESPKGSVTSENPISTSYSVASESDLKACDSSRLGFLVYIKDIEEFRSCEASGWTKVVVKGKDGKDGKNGSMVSGNQWYDPITKKMWLMTNIATYTFTFSDIMSTCAGDYRIPLKVEAQEALAHGLGVVAQALPSAPTLIMVSMAVERKMVKIANGVTVDANGDVGTLYAAQFCIEK